jgi:HSP20 family protein
MAITRWEPFRDLMTMQERMNRLFNEFFSRPAGYEEESTVQGKWTPAVDIYETDSEVVLKAELPGMTQEDIHIEIRENVLTLKGERKQESEAEEGEYHRVERSYGTFQRMFTLPSVIQHEKVKARYKDGVLEVTMPKAEAAKPKHIAIEG